MKTFIASASRGFADHGWLKSFHSFSFAGYHDPQRIQFGNLRVINEDRIAAGTGFGTHGHQDMEIVSYVLSGQLAHKDSIGTGATIVPGEVQRMSAGSGIRHSEFNANSEGETHFLQIWILPNKTGIAPSYEQKMFAPEDKRGRLCLVASADGQQGAVCLNADASIYAGLFDGAETATLSLRADRKYYIQAVRGQLSVNGHRLQNGDALAMERESELTIQDGKDAEVLVFDLQAV